MTAAIEMVDMGKAYRLDARPSAWLRAVVAPRRARPGSVGTDGALWALRHLRLAIDPSEVVGIVGHNGAGKSTLLRLIAGITRPTEGELTVRGRVGSLIELGASFHPELTGRENIVLAGQIAGLTRKAVARQMDAIVAFSELERFIDVPVKRYSSGMYARLGFAVAVHVDPEILLVDEVLAVGDLSFQRRSMDRMLQLVRDGRTVLFVSHNLVAVERMCARVVWLDHGRVRMDGAADEVLRAFLASEEERFSAEPTRIAAWDDRLRVTACVVVPEGVADDGIVRSGSDMRLEVTLEAADVIPSARVSVGVVTPAGPLFLANMLLDGARLHLEPGERRVACRFRAVPLMPGAYRVFGEVWADDGANPIVPWGEWARLRVEMGAERAEALDPAHSVTHARADAPVHVPYEWLDV